MNDTTTTEQAEATGWAIRGWAPATPPPPPSRLSESQVRMYHEIVRHCAEQGGNAPSIRELMKLLGINSTSLVARHLKHLERVGLIRLTTGSARGIIVVGSSWTPPSPDVLAEVLGVAA